MRKKRQANRKNSGALEKAPLCQLLGPRMHRARPPKARLQPPVQQLVTHGRGHCWACQNQIQPTDVWEEWKGSNTCNRSKSGWAAIVKSQHCPTGAHHVGSCSGTCPVGLPSFACRGWDPLAVMDEAPVRDSWRPPPSSQGSQEVRSLVSIPACQFWEPVPCQEASAHRVSIRVLVDGREPGLAQASCRASAILAPGTYAPNGQPEHSEALQEAGGRRQAVGHILRTPGESRPRVLLCQNLGSRNQHSLLFNLL